MNRRLCVVCNTHPIVNSVGMCRSCCKSYDRSLSNTSTWAAIEWAAKRARLFERRRRRR
jgi:hypothetical protein